MRKVSAMNVSEVLASQLEMTNSTWEVLQQEGARAGEQRPVDYFFYTSNERNARALSEAMGTDDAPVAEVTSTRVGILRRKVVWGVHGTTAPLLISLESLRGWVTRMVELGASHEAEFDGWGTEV